MAVEEAPGAEGAEAEVEVGLWRMAELGIAHTRYIYIYVYIYIYYTWLFFMIV